MKLKSGYKQTEVGVIPEDWASCQIGEVFAFKNGLNKAKEFFGRGTPIVNYMDVFERPGLQVEDLQGRVTLNKAELDRFDVRAGDVFFTRTSETVEDIGVAAVMLGSPHATVFSGFVLRGRTLGNHMEDSFKQYCFANASVRSQIVSTATYTTRALTNGRLLSSVWIAIPPRPEQRAIAVALSDADALLEGLDRLIAKKRDLKQAAMQQLLTGKTRLPGFEGDWGTKTLFDLAERKKELFDDGDWIESEHITTEGIRLIQTGNIGVGGFIEKENRKYINQRSFTSLRCKQLRKGDLLVCRLADPAGRACVLPDIGEERIVTSVDVTIFRPPTEKADRVFLANVFSTPEWFRAVSDRSGGTTHKRISRGALGRITIKLPPIPEQTAIAAVLSNMDAEIEALENRRAKTAGLKQGMMQELLTGRIRLVDSQGAKR